MYIFGKISLKVSSLIGQPKLVNQFNITNITNKHF